MQGNLLKQAEQVVDVWQEEGGVRLQEQLNIFVRDIALVQTHLKKVTKKFKSYEGRWMLTFGDEDIGRESST